MKALGIHFLVEYFNCNKDILNDARLIEESMKFAANKSGATVVNSVFHHFNPHGVSGVVVIAESHFTIHTWPEYHFAAADFFTCGQDIDSDSAIETLRIALKSDTYERQEIPRGKIDSTNEFLPKTMRPAGKSKKSLNSLQNLKEQSM